MEISREMLIEIAVSVGAVGLFVAAIVAVGTTYGEAGLIGEEGSVVFVGAIALFVVVMTGIGYWLSGRES